MLQELNPAFGIRDITEVKAQAEACGLSLVEQIYIESSNNFLNVFQKDKT